MEGDYDQKYPTAWDFHIATQQLTLGRSTPGRIELQHLGEADVVPRRIAK
jgi:hypothetical protein